VTRAEVTHLSVLIVNYNSWRVCVDAVASLREQRPHLADGRPMPYEVIVVDNDSPMRDEEAEAELSSALDALASNEGCRGELIRHGENGGYGKGMNLAYSHATGDAILICNPDLVFLPNCVDKLLRHIEEHDDVGAAAPEGFWDSELEGRLPPNILPTLGDLLALFAASLSPRMVRRYARKRTVEALKVWTATEDVALPMLSGCCFLMRRSTIDKVGFFDERFPLYYEDTDLSVRIRKAGYRIVQVHESRLVHLYNRSGQTDNELALRRYYVSRRAYYRKWYGFVGGVIYGLTRWIQGMGWAQRRNRLCPQLEIHELGSHKGPPVIEFDRDHDKVLVEVALDPNFYLAAAMFGRGRRWTIGAQLFHSFGPMQYFFRVLDLGGETPRLIGVYTYTRIAWDAPEPEASRKEAHID
jgi:GT2 family glycosyltransferase